MIFTRLTKVQCLNFISVEPQKCWENYKLLLQVFIKCMTITHYMHTIYIHIIYVHVLLNVHIYYNYVISIIFLLKGINYMSILYNTELYPYAL